MQLILTSLLLGALADAASIPRVVYVEKRAVVTYAATCTTYNTVPFLGQTTVLSSACAYATKSGPNVGQNCYSGIIVAFCGASTTATSCSTTTYLTTIINIFGGTAQSQVTSSTCTNALFGPTPVAAVTTTTVAASASATIGVSVSIGLPTSILPTSVSLDLSTSIIPTSISLSLPTSILPTSILPTSISLSLPTTLPTSILPTSILPTSISLSLPTSILPTSILPTSVLPTSISLSLPTSILPTSILPTSILPTSILPTSILPTSILPTSVLPTSVLPTSILPTSILPTTILPTSVLPTSILPTSILPTSLSLSLPTSILPTSILPTSVLPTSILPTSLSLSLTTTPVLSTTPVLPTTLSTSTVSATPLPTNAAGVTCYADNINGVRTLSGASTSSNSMTNGVCKTYCNNLGFAYSGTEYSSECYCGNNLPTTSSSACNMVCSATGSNEICGGPNALSVSVNPTIVATNNQNAVLLATWPAQGCYQDNYPSRILKGASTSSNTMTVESCLAFCNAAGNTLAGLEYGSECYCGNTVQTDGSTYGISGQTGCTYGCAGNSAETCGGSNVLNIYSRTGAVGLTPVSSPSPVPATAAGYAYVNCYSDNGPSGRTLVTQKSNVVSVEACVSACASSGFRYAGVEFRGECWCDNAIRGGATVIPASNCLLPCDGTPSETCGGSNAIQIYTGAPNSAAAAVAIPPSAGGYTYAGSYTDSTSKRVLPNQQTLSSTTVANCVAACSDRGFAYAGLEYGSECWCGSSIANNPTGGQTPTTPCTGNPAQLCGGSNIIQIYSGVPTPRYLTTPFTNGVCVADNTNNVRTLPVLVLASSSMTPNVCKTACVSYTYYGVEYGSECWCGNAFASGTVYSQSCTMACSGENTQICGGSYALNIYNSS